MRYIEKHLLSLINLTVLQLQNCRPEKMHMIQVYFIYRGYGAMNSLDVEHFYINVVSKISRLKRSKPTNIKKP